jgi:hypothetical protein
MTAYDLIGQRFGKLVVIKRVENNASGKAVWFCCCDCGGTTNVAANDLVRI